MALYFEGVTYAGWNSASEAGGPSTASTNNDTPVQIVQGTAFEFNSHQSFVHYISLTNGSVNDIVVNNTFQSISQLGTRDATMFHDNVTGNYVANGAQGATPNIEYLGPSAAPLLYDQEHVLRDNGATVLEASMTVQTSNHTSGSISTQGWFRLASQQNLGTARYFTFTRPDTGSLVVQKTSNVIFNSNILSDGDVVKAELTATDYNVYVNDVLQVTEPRTVRYTLSTAAENDGHTLSSGSTQAVPISVAGNATDTINIPLGATPGTYSVRAEYCDGEFDSAVYTVIDDSLPPITDITDDVTPPESMVYQGHQNYCFDIGPDISTATNLFILTSSDVDVTTDFTPTETSPNEWCMNIPCDQTPATYTIRVEDSADSNNFSEYDFTVVQLEPIVPSHPSGDRIVGQTTQFSTTHPNALTWGGDADINPTTGEATWTSAGTKTIEYTTTDGSCVISINYEVLMPITVAEYDPLVDSCIYLNVDETLALTVSGGSGNYSYSINGQTNEIDNTGLITAGDFGGEFIATIVDDDTGEILNIPLCIGSQDQFCVEVESSECEQNAQACCEINVDCNESVTLRVPTFHVRENGVESDVIYTTSTGGNTDEGGYFVSTSANAEASANEVNCASDEYLFEIVTSTDMADTANGEFAIGFDNTNSASGVGSIERAVVWLTDTSVRYVEIRNEGTAETDSRVEVAVGDSISAGYLNGKFVLYKNGLLSHTSVIDSECCGTEFLKVFIETAGKSIGGSLSGLTWTITTPGSPDEVGAINANGVYIPSNNGYQGLVQAEATIGSSKFKVNIRNTKPLVRYTDPNATMAGRPVEIWVGPYVAGFTGNIRLAKDGTPDSIQNPGMIDLGVLEGSANFAEALEYQDFDNDLGTYHTSIVKESATMSATFLEVRDLHKMAQLMPHSTLYSKANGYTELGVGGKRCTTGELRVIMVIGSPNCEEGIDVIYIPRVQNKGNLGLEVGRRANGKYEINFTALPDYTRPPGKQLYSIYRVDDCSTDSCEIA